MYYITYNGVVTPQSYDTRDDAIRELKKLFGDIEFDIHGVAYWYMGTTVNTKVKIQICRYAGEIE